MKLEQPQMLNSTNYILNVLPPETCAAIFVSTPLQAGADLAGMSLEEYTSLWPMPVS